MVSGALAEQATTEGTSDMAGLTDDQKRHYEEQGYVFLRQLFAPNEIQPLIDEIDAAVAGQAQNTTTTVALAPHTTTTDSRLAS